MKTISTLTSVIVVVVIAICTTTTSADEPRNCDNPVPGSFQMLTGVDITKLDLRPNLDGTEDTGTRKALFSMSCNRGRVFIGAENQIHYDLADQIQIALPQSAVMSQSIQTEVATTTDFRLDAQGKVGLGGDILKLGSFSASVGFESVVDSFISSQSTSYILEASLSTLKIELQMAPLLNASLDPNFVTMVGKLSPEGYLADPVPYENLIDAFGTHYWTSALFGGVLTQRSTLTSEYVAGSNQLAIDFALSADFKKFFNANAGYNETDHDGQNSTHLGLTSVFRSFGGLPLGGVKNQLKAQLQGFKAKEEAKAPPKHLLKAEQQNLTQLGGSDEGQNAVLAAWLPSVYAQPWLDSGTLRPISELVMLPNNPNNISTALDQAVRVHQLRAELNSIKRILEQTATSTSNDNEQASSDPQVQNLTAEVDAYLTQVSTAAGAVELTDQLSTEARRLINHIDFVAVDLQMNNSRDASGAIVLKTHYSIPEANVEEMRKQVRPIDEGEAAARATEDVAKLKWVSKQSARMYWAIVACALGNTAYSDPFYRGYC